MVRVGGDATVTLYHYSSDRCTNVEPHTHGETHIGPVVVQSLSRV